MAFSSISLVVSSRSSNKLLDNRYITLNKYRCAGFAEGVNYPHIYVGPGGVSEIGAIPCVGSVINVDTYALKEQLPPAVVDTE
jgi:hypothetical protein